MTRAITIATALSVVIAFAVAIPTTIATILLTEGRDAVEQTETNQSGEQEDSIPIPSLKTIHRNKPPNKQLLSLIWGDGDLSPIPIPFPAASKNTKAIRNNLDLWSLFFGRWNDSNDIANSVKDNGYKEDKERIRKTLKKFYGLADPKFARASLASVTRKNNGNINQLPGSTATENSFDLDKQDEEANEADEEQDELLPGTVLEVFFENDAYELVEQIQLELGATPQHYMDFAYKSVTASSYSYSSSSSSSSYSSSSSSSSSKTSSRMGECNDFLISGEIDVILGEDQHTCKDIIFPSKGEEDGDNDNDNDDDRAMEFFAAWWKWWLPFANSQWWKDNGSSKANYDMGKSPFAGGSNGEVWRGRRVCHRTQRPSSRDSHHDYGNDSHRAFFSSHRQNGNAERYDNEDDDYSQDDWADEEFDEFDETEEQQQEEFRTNDCDDQTPLVLKRLRVERGYLLLEAGLREVYFGKMIARVLEETQQDMYTVYVDHFFREVPRRRRAFGGLPKNNHHGGNDLELWIVYEDAGPSLRSYIYSPIVSDDGFVMHQHSKLWTKLRTFAGEKKAKAHKNDIESDSDSKDSDSDSSVEFNRDRKLGRMFMQKTLREILAAAAELHKRGIVHRDIKPSNVMCQSETPLSAEELFESESLSSIVCKLGDFSSGWDRYTSENLYTKGPTPGEQTNEYAPPESYVGPHWKPFDDEKPQSYDSWSIGVLALELLLGTPNVFSIDQRTSALLTHKLKRARASDDEIAYALYLAALSNFCIFVPSNDTTREDSWPLRYGDPLHKTAMVKESCSLQDFHRALRSRDPLGIGFDSSTDLLLNLIWQLLAFDPSERKTAEEALRHPYFISPDGTLDSLHQIPGYHNSLISEILDDRIDFDVEDDIKSFACPSCGRVFHDWRSCHKHANLRKHAKFCVYNHTVLPSCINTHSMLPEHPTSGYCDLQGRRKTIEDFHSIHLHHEHQFYGIFDGHTGNLASKFAASELYTELLTQLPDLMQIGGQKSPDDDDRYAWKEEIRINVTNAFETVHERFLDRITTMTSPISEVGSAPKMDQSGTTATALLVTQDVVIAAVLGDSRGVLASAKSSGSESPSSSGKKSKKSQWNNFPEVSAIPFSIDHVASDPTERDLVLERGGFVTKSRVNGTLAITRSIGDANLAPVLSREPHVRVLDRSELRELCGDLGRAPSPLDPSGDENEPNTSSSNNRTIIPCFVILASDGLWDVMSNQEAVDMVVDIILRHNEALAASFQPGDTTREVALFPSYDDIDDDDDDEGSGGPFQESAERLAVEAYVRGSTDNIGVCVVAID